MNSERNLDSQNQDEIDERQILELLRTSMNDEDNTNTNSNEHEQPMLQAANPIDAEKNHRE
jgi:hypothetical protein